MRAVLFLLACPAMLLAQLDSDTLTVNVNQIVPTAPDQAVFTVIVGTPANIVIDDVLAALAPAGVTVSDLSGATTFTPVLQPQPQSFWYFQPVIPLAKLNDELGALARIQQNLGKSTPPWTFSYSVVGTQTSAAAKPACAYTTLVSYAQKQAQQIASAAGVKVGPVIGLDGQSGRGVWCTGNRLPNRRFRGRSSRWRNLRCLSGGSAGGAHMQYGSAISASALSCLSSGYRPDLRAAGGVTS